MFSWLSAPVPSSSSTNVWLAGGGVGMAEAADALPSWPRMTEVAPKPTAVKAAAAATYAPIMSARRFLVPFTGPPLFDPESAGSSLSVISSRASTRHIFLGFVSCGRCFFHNSPTVTGNHEVITCR
jgi:hypothetical protein